MTEHVQCAVCSKSTPKQAAVTVYHQGKTFYTCGPSCRQQFAGNPGKYAQTATASKGPAAAAKPAGTTPPSPKRK